jgi:glucokinase
MSGAIFLGIDCGATTSKVGAVNAAGDIISRELRQSDTCAELGAHAIVRGWMAGATGFLAANGLTWADVGGVGLAIPGPYLGHGILGRMPNMPSTLVGWHFLDDLHAAVARAAGNNIPVVTANDGLLAGMAEAQTVQSKKPGGVLMLAPGSGLGCSYVTADGRLLSGDHGAAVILCHMPAPFERLGLPVFRCGCGRDWGCFEAYTAIAGLPQYLEQFLPKYPGHPLNDGAPPDKSKALRLRGLAREGDPLAMEIFDCQARALGHAVTVGCMAYDPTHIIIGGGLMDHTATTPAFRENYVRGVRQGADECLWGNIDDLEFHQAALGELSQAIGAALLARELREQREAPSPRSC